VSYVDQNLMNGEQVVYRAKLHWIVFKWAPFWFALAFIALLGSTIEASSTKNPDGHGSTVVVLFAIAGLATIIAYLNYSFSEFAVTNRRVIIKVGTIRRTSLETLLNKVEGVAVAQGLQARLFGYGTIIVNGTGSTKAPFKRISQPFEFRRHVQEQIEANRGQGSVA